MTERPRKARPNADDLRGVSKLAIHATTSVTSVVESMHRTIASGPDLLGRPLRLPARALTGLVYGTIRGITGVVGVTLDATLAALTPLLGESAPGPQREALQAALNGVVGDYLEETDNPLAIRMTLRHAGHPIELDREALRALFPDVPRAIVLMVHGSSMADVQWRREGHDHGEALARDLGVCPIYVHYNSGRHVSVNGAELAHVLDALVSAWPVPVERLVVVAHSMGGLVTRAACLTAEREGLAWRRALKDVVFLGTPHHGAPLEQGGHWLHYLLGISKYSAPLARLAELRSAGVTDLRFGNVRDEDWRDRDRFAPSVDRRKPLPLPDGVRCFAIAGTTTKGDAKRLMGDGLVPVASALGQHEDEARALGFPDGRRWIASGAGHLDLLNRADVYERVRGWLAP